MSWSELIAQQATQAENPSTFNWTLIIVGIIGSGALTALLAGLFNMRKGRAESGKADAEAAELIQRAAGSLVEQFRAQNQQLIEQNERLCDQVDALHLKVEGLQRSVDRIPELETQVRELTKVVDLLSQQLKDHGITPVYPPMPPGPV